MKVKKKKLKTKAKIKTKKFKTISFKITYSQRKSLDNYCKANNTTPVKLIKKAMHKYLTNYNEIEKVKPVALPNQLNLFD